MLGMVDFLYGQRSPWPAHRKLWGKKKKKKNKKKKKKKKEKTWSLGRHAKATLCERRTRSRLVSGLSPRLQSAW